MNWKILVITMVLIFAAGAVAGYMCRKSYEKVPVVLKGKEDVKTVKGTEVPKVIEKTFVENKKQAPVVKTDSTLYYEYRDTTDLYKLKLMLTVHKDTDSINICKDLQIKEVEKLRTDTLIITRVDTLEVKKLVTEDQPFYKTVGFGFSVGVAVTVLIAAIVQAVL